MAEQADVVIVGGGVTGLALAFEVSRFVPKRVVVVEKRYTGSGASGRNVGRLRAMQLTPELAHLAIAAQRKHERLVDELGFNTLFWRAGYAWVLYESSEVERMTDLLPMLQTLDMPEPRILDEEETLRLLPILRGGEKPAGALLGRDALVHHDAVVYAYRRRCQAAGVQILEGCTVTGVRVENGRVSGVDLEEKWIHAPVVVNASDGWSREISAMAGVEVPNTPFRREVLVTEPARPFMGPAVTFYRPVEGWFNQTLRGELVAGVTSPSEPEGMRQESSAAFLDRTAHALVQKAPRLGHLRVIRQWAGVYDMTPDRKPLVGPVHHPKGFIQANGYSGRGFLLAPLVAELLADWIVTGRRPELLALCESNRFEGRAKEPIQIGDYYEGYTRQ